MLIDIMDGIAADRPRSQQL